MESRSEDPCDEGRMKKEGRRRTECYFVAQLALPSPGNWCTAHGFVVLEGKHMPSWS